MQRVLLFSIGFLFIASGSFAQPGYMGKKFAVLADLYPNPGYASTYNSGPEVFYFKLRPGVDFNYTFSRSTAIGLSYDYMQAGTGSFQMKAHTVELNILGFSSSSGYVAPVGFFYMFEVGACMATAVAREGLVPTPIDPSITDSLNLGATIGIGVGFQRIIKDIVLVRLCMKGNWLTAHVFQTEKAVLWERLAIHRAFNINIGVGVPF